jgi:hypothetical protein
LSTATAWVWISLHCVDISRRKARAWAGAQTAVSRCVCWWNGGPSGPNSDLKPIPGLRVGPDLRFTRNRGARNSAPFGLREATAPAHCSRSSRRMRATHTPCS